MYQPVQYLKIGNTGKSFGKDGKVRLFINEEFDHLMEKTDHIYIWERGQYVPYFIAYLDDKNDLLVKFEELDSADATDQVSNKEVFVSDLQVNFNDYKSVVLLQTNELTGYTVFDQNSGISVTITDVKEYPSQTMIVASINGSGQEILIPFVEDWLAGIDEKNRALIMDLPGGLLSVGEEE
jgi:16S rRNA processing protein RimM